ncbi:MAG: tryptophan synthase alpha chain [Actinomycetota bacterium]|nr:tryptophan synthase alpha chain [Actinomycetota bacterium]
MSGVAAVMASTKAQGRAALIGYLPVGFPDVAGSIDAMVAMVEAGVDIVEIGVPYTDPLMDGPVIAHAADVALQGGTRLKDVFTAVRAVADAGAPALVMTYWNPVLRYGVDRFADDLAKAGGAGLITPDLIPDEGAEWIAAADRHDLDHVFLVAPSSTPQRLRSTTAACSGFVYAASSMGVTGTRTTVGDAAQVLVTRTRLMTELPICVGLGVSTGAQAGQVAAFADGVIVGSALVRALTDAGSPRERLTAIGELSAELAAGVRDGR